MSAMKRIRVPMHRYGEADFDKEYMNWGLHDRETQAREAESLSQLLDKECGILDLACGIGAHAIHWAKRGHAVTAVDLSETLIGKAREMAAGEGVDVEFKAAFEVRRGVGWDEEGDLPRRARFDAERGAGNFSVLIQ